MCHACARSIRRARPPHTCIMIPRLLSCSPSPPLTFGYLTRVCWPRPDLKDAWDRMNKKQRTELLQQLPPPLSPPQHQDAEAGQEQEQTATAVSARVGVPASTIAGDHKQTERVSMAQERLGEISATALKKLSAISASRTSKLTPDANPKSDVSGKCPVGFPPVVTSNCAPTHQSIAGATLVERDD
jgi:hypothetical protein